MKIKAVMAALALALAPSVALAWGGCSTMKPEQTASSCADGQIWDGDSAACVDPVAS